MCATKTRPQRIRWGGLYAVVLSAFTAATTIAVVSPPGPWRIGVTLVVFSAAGIAIMKCLATQRLALDLSEWCECAKSTVTMRIVDASEAAPPKYEESAEERPYAGTASAR